ncbi:hypothetical protein GCK72_024669 [Caenorhabditis remanei]|uniref:Uncharacterized protein n=2 Tax=Caenorhabditis remanei TaxID=31234 RepID=E3LD92_CAERE|nr:hypothetical protein GCK72_024669 [Caenorhabditis remanei]EFO82646.1 hypothetical protein CRE_00120 [Caenorhabditis remanei]KAF1748202.1 hypothetical protein GCK72_024669 [Caenorhabditis remanei]
MPRNSELFFKIIFSPQVANTVLGLLVAKFYLDWPQKYGYPVFAIYYFLMAYEFFWYVKANWRAAFYGEDDVVEEEEVRNEENETYDENEKEIVVPKVIPRPRLIEYPPPVDSEDECVNETDEDDSDCVIVELPDDDTDDEYHEASEGM